MWPIPALYCCRVRRLEMTANVLLMTLAGALVNGPYALITTAVSADLSTHESLKGGARSARSPRSSTAPVR